MSKDKKAVYYDSGGVETIKIIKAKHYISWLGKNKNKGE